MHLRLKEIRTTLGLSQKEFGKHLFLSQSRVSMLELEKGSITERTIHLLGLNYKVNRNWFITGIDEMFDP